MVQIHLVMFVLDILFVMLSAQMNLSVCMTGTSFAYSLLVYIFIYTYLYIPSCYSIRFELVSSTCITV